jgi:antitoxin VapB
VLRSELLGSSQLLAYGGNDEEAPMMTMERHVRLFRSGGNQALRIPSGFELPGMEVLLRKEGDRLIVEPAKRKALLNLLAGWEPLQNDLPQIEDAAPEPVDL